MTTVIARPQTWIAGNQKWILLAAIVILGLVYPFIVRSYWLSLGIEVLIFAIFAMSLDLLLGYTGLPSFGHAAFFGLGAYIVASVTSTNKLALGLTDNLLISLPLVMMGTG